MHKSIRMHVVPNGTNSVYIESGDYYGFQNNAAGEKEVKRFTFEEVITKVQGIWGDDSVTFDRKEAANIIVPRFDSKVDKDRPTWPFVMLLHPNATDVDALRKLEPTKQQIKDALVAKIYKELVNKKLIEDVKPTSKEEPVPKPENMYHLRLTPIPPATTMVVAPNPTDVTQGIVPRKKRSSRKKSRKSSR